MVDWLHCNICYHQPGDGLKFSLTSCGHIYCEKCTSQLQVSAGGQVKCKMCGIDCSTILLSGQMKPDVEVYFTDPSELVKRHNRQLLQVVDFQKNHRKRLHMFMRDKMAQQQQFVEKAQKSCMQVQELAQEINKIKEENFYLKKLVSEKGLSASRPGCSSSSPRGCKLSPYYRTQPDLMSNANANTPTSLGARISVRTPPSQGRMGNVRGSMYMDTRGSSPNVNPTPNRDTPKLMHFVSLKNFKSPSPQFSLGSK